VARKPVKINKEVGKLASLILTGTMLVFDPASRKLGYSYYVNGEFEESGPIQLDEKKSISHRLNELTHIITAFPTVDVLAVERIRGSRAHIYLTWSVGVIVAGGYCNNLIEVPVSTWHKFAGKGHVKSDEADAVAMGDCLIAMARGTFK